MEHGLFQRIRRTLRGLGRRRSSGRQRYTDAGVLEVYLWAALNDRPVSWACDAKNWPPGTRRGVIPNASTICRRMRTDSIRRLLERLRRVLEGHQQASLIAIIDGKPLPIGPHSHDRQAGYGRAASGKAKGYKLHAIIDGRGRVLDWRVAPMNGDERTIGRRMVRDLSHRGYLLADSNYDANHLFDAAGRHGVQLLAPRRGGRTLGLGHRRQSPGRLRSRELIENDPTGFGHALLKQRWRIERFFGQLTSAPGGLGYLPAWIRTWSRVRNWVAAKIAIHAARASLRREPLMQ